MFSEIKNPNKESVSIEEYRKRIEQFEESAHDGIVVLDENTICINVNPRLAEMVGYEISEILGRSSFDFIAPSTKELVWDKFDSKDTGAYKAKLTRKDGSEMTCVLQGSNITINDKHIRITTVRDITELDKIKYQLELRSETFESLFNNSQVGVILLDMDRNIKRSNNKAAQIFGYKTAAEVIGKNTLEFHLSQEHSDKFYREYRARISTQKNAKTDYQFQDKTGKLIWLSVSGSAVDTNTPPDLGKGLIWVMEDISDRKKAEQDLKEAHDELESIYHNSFVGIAVLKNGRIVHRVNNTAVEMLGYTDGADAKGRSVVEWHLSQERFEDFGKTFYNSLINHTIKELDYQLKKKDGTPTWVTLSGKAIDPNIPADLNKGVIWILQDINERKQMEQQLQQNNKELQELNENKDKFISILAHDLKGPLGTINGFMKLILDNYESYDKETIRTRLIHMQSSLGKTYTLLDEILYWIKSQLDRLEIKLEKLVFSDICNDTIEQAYSEANLKHITIKCHNIDSLYVKADENMVKTIFRNLVFNAIKFTNENGEIIITAEIEETHARITIADNGVGIKEENLSKLWDISEYHSTPGTANEIGTGMGLKLCKELVSKQNGIIGVKSKLGKGSEFYFTLPLFKE